MRIPRDLRNVKMKDLKQSWGGDWGSTLRRLKEETLKNRMEADKGTRGQTIERELGKSIEVGAKRKVPEDHMNSEPGPSKRPS